MPVVIVWGKGETTDAERARITRSLRGAGIERAEIDVKRDGRISVRTATIEDIDVREAAEIALREAGFAVVGEK